MSSIKRKLVNLPVVGDLLLIGSNVIHLPRNRSIEEKRFNAIDESIGQLSKQLANLGTKLEEIDKKIASTQTSQDNLHQQLALLEKSASISKPSTPAAQPAGDKQLFADDHLLDIFYTKFEDKFRGDEKIVMENLRDYLPYFRDSAVDFKKHPVLDIGSGRGEMLQLLKEAKIPAHGLDINIDMVERANAKGLETKQGDALSYLESLDSQSLGAITGFHIMEHIPFAELLKIFKEARRCLTSDGFVIFETPNPENLVVGSTTFYYDPSHLHPLPPMLMAYTLETSGFRNVEVLRLHPDDDQHTKDVNPTVGKYLFGPRDYAVIGYK